MRRHVGPFIAGVVVLGLVVAFALVQHARHVRPTVPKVVRAATLGALSPGAAVGAPDLSARGWHVVGGRVDVIGGRTVRSVGYRRGTAMVIYARMADTDGLNDAVPGWASSYGRLQLNWQNVPPLLQGGVRPGRLTARFVAHGHQAVLTGPPYSEANRRRMVVLAGLLAGH